MPKTTPEPSPISKGTLAYFFTEPDGWWLQATFQHLPCGCSIVGAGIIPAPLTIKQCPIHAAAPDLLKALRKLEARADYLTRLHNGSEVKGPRGVKSWGEDAEKAIGDVEDSTAKARAVLAKVQP